MAIADLPARPTLDLQPDTPPLRAWPDGTVRVGHTRVLLELVIQAFTSGDTPEQITQRYTAVTLPDAYGVIAYYQRHREAVDAYVAAYEAGARVVRARIEAEQPDRSALRARLRAHRVARAEGEG